MKDKYGRTFVDGTGRMPADVMIVGEAPGFNEDRYGKPWIGKAGKELRRYARDAGIDTRTARLTNLVKYRPFSNKGSGNSAPTPEDIERDAPRLIEEIRKTKPRWIVAAGRVPSRWFFEDDVDIDDVAGFAFPDLPRARGAIVIPVYHPAAGIHQAELQPHTHRSFLRAGEYIRGERKPVPPVDQFPDPDYYEVRSGMLTVPSNLKIAVDTEGVYGKAWCLTYSMLPGSAGMVLRKNKKATQYAKDLLLNNTIGLHNASHDLRILAELLEMPLIDLLYRIKFEDTMQMAYVLRLLPIGLKALCLRLMGMRMNSYMSVVAPADRQIMLDWFKEVLKYRCEKCDGLGERISRPKSEKTGKRLQPRLVKCDNCGGDGTGWEPPEEQLVVKAGKASISSGRRLGWRVRRILEDADKVDPKTGRLTDLRERWEGLKKDNYTFAVQAEDKLGPPRPVTLDDVPFPIAKQYACTDADGTKRIWPELYAEVEREGLLPVYEMDRNVIPMVTRMMDVGWKIDTEFLRIYSNKLSIQQDKILYSLEGIVGHPVNPNSPKQMGEILFGEFGLHPVRLTDTGDNSTDNKVLADLRILCVSKMENKRERARYEGPYNFISGALDWKERSKLRSSFTEKLPRMVDEFSRLHPRVKQAATESGRLACADPNLQNIPARTDLGRMIRRAFICGEGNVLLSADYGQIEMRILAHESGEKLLIKAIKDGLDVHNLTCQKIFGIPMDKAKGTWQRDAAKTLGFGIVYGISAPALKTQIKLLSAKHTKGGVDVPVEQCEEWIYDYTTRTYPAIGDFMSDSQAEARRVGYVQDMFGRRRYLPGVHSDVNSVRAEAERIATNHKIQAAAQGVIKLAMSEIFAILPKYRKRGFAECIMQVHDELIFEVKRELAEELKAEVEKIMTGVVRLKVPLTADGKVGLSWKELKD